MVGSKISDDLLIVYYSPRGLELLVQCCLLVEWPASSIMRHDMSGSRSSVTQQAAGGIPRDTSSGVSGGTGAATITAASLSSTTDSPHNRSSSRGIISVSSGPSDGDHSPCFSLLSAVVGLVDRSVLAAPEAPCVVAAGGPLTSHPGNDGSRIVQHLGLLAPLRSTTICLDRVLL